MSTIQPVATAMESTSESVSEREEDVSYETAASIIVRILEASPIVDPEWKKDSLIGQKNQPKRKFDAPLLVSISLKAEEVLQVCELGVQSFSTQPNLLTFDRSMLPLSIVADLHGQLIHALRIFRTVGSPLKKNYLFLGDYVDRGVQGIELVLFLVCLKIRYPSRVFLLRGNHEDVNTTLSYGFYDEVMRRWPKAEEGDRVYRAFLKMFNHMPLAALVASKIFCCHGGISPFMNSVQDINSKKVTRASIIPAYGLGCDLVWADPATNVDNWTLSHRGISFVFGARQLEEFCDKNGVELLIRGHQISQEMHRRGYKFMFNGRLITLFSAPNYMNYRNCGAIVVVDEKLAVTFHSFRTKMKEDYKMKKKLKPKAGKKCRPRAKKSSANDDDTEVDRCKQTSFADKSGKEKSKKSSLLMPPSD